MLKIALLAFGLALTSFTTFTASTTPVLAGPCQHEWDQASDGSRCGGRSADDKAGGD